MSDLSRRGVMKGLALAAVARAGGLLAEPAVTGSDRPLEQPAGQPVENYPATAPGAGDIINASDTSPVAATQNGPVRGCAEIAFVFDNVARCENMTGNGPAARALAARVSDAWIHFARTGNPNHSGLPHWNAFDSSTRGVMVFDNQCTFHDHLEDALQEVIDPVNAA